VPPSTSSPVTLTPKVFLPGERTYVTVSVMVVDTDADPVTVIVYVPAGVPFGLVVVPPPLLPLEPQPVAKDSSKSANVPRRTNVNARRLPNPRGMRSEIPRRVSVAGHRSMWKRILVINTGTTAARDVVVITKEAVEPAETVTGLQAASLGNPEHVRGYEVPPTSVIVKVAGEPAVTVSEEGVALIEDKLPKETFKTVLPPAPVSGGPKGATMM